MLDKLFAHHGERLKQDRSEQERATLLRCRWVALDHRKIMVGAAVFLAVGRKAANITGQTLNVDAAFICTDRPAARRPGLQNDGSQSGQQT